MDDETRFSESNQRVFATLSEKLEYVTDYLNKYFEPHICRNMVDSVISELVIDTILGKEYNHEALDLASSMQNPIYGNDITETIAQMALQARDRSNGAAPLYKVYISTKDYNDITTGLRLDTEIPKLTICRVPVYKSDELTKYHSVFGLCKPKFSPINVEFLTMVGQVEKQ